VHYNINVPKPGVIICTAFCEIKISVFRDTVFYLFRTFITTFSDYLLQYLDLFVIMQMECVLSDIETNVADSRLYNLGERQSSKG
jgi:hypothetical protein